MSTIRSDLTLLPRSAWVLFGGTFVNRFGQFVVPFLVLYLTRQGYSATQAGWALSLYGAGSLGAGLVGGHLADRMGRRETIALSMFSAGLVTLALGMARDLGVILMLTAAAGFTAELYRPAASAFLADVTPPGERLTAFSMYRLAVNAGTGLGPAVAGLLAERSFLLLFVGDAITSLLYGAVAMVALARAPVAFRSRARGPSATATMLRDRQFLLLLVACVAVGVVFHQAYATLPLHIRAMGHPSRVYGLLMALNGVLIVCCELTLTAFTRRFAPRAVMATGILLAGVGFALTGLARSAPALAATVVVWTVGEMAFSPMVAAHVADIAPPALRGRYQAALGLTFAIGMTLAPLAGTALLDVDPRLPWIGCLVLGVAGAALVVGARGETVSVPLGEGAEARG